MSERSGGARGRGVKKGELKQNPSDVCWVKVGIYLTIHKERKSH